MTLSSKKINANVNERTITMSHIKQYVSNDPVEMASNKRMLEEAVFGFVRGKDCPECGEITQRSATHDTCIKCGFVIDYSADFGESPTEMRTQYGYGL